MCFLSTDTKQTVKTNVKTPVRFGRNQISQHSKCLQMSERQQAPAVLIDQQHHEMIKCLFRAAVTDLSPLSDLAPGISAQQTTPTRREEHPGSGI